MVAGGATGPGSPQPVPAGEAEAVARNAAADAAAAEAPTPDIAEALRQVGAAGKSGFEAANDAAKAFRSLFFADISLARSAFGRTVALTGLAIACGASAWLLLMASLIVWLRGGMGWTWTVAMLACAGLSIAIAALAGYGAMRYFEHTRLKATRRQMARLGFGELASLTPTPGSPTSAREATEHLSDTTPGGQPRTDSRGVPVTPP